MRYDQTQNKSSRTKAECNTRYTHRMKQFATNDTKYIKRAEEFALYARSEQKVNKSC